MNEPVSKVGAPKNGPYASFIQNRMDLMGAAQDDGLKAHFQAEIDLVNSWGQPNDIGAAPPTEGASPPVTNVAASTLPLSNKLTVTTTPTNFTPDVDRFNKNAPNGRLSLDERADFAKQLAAHFRSKYQLSDEAIAGIFGNFIQESGFSPNIRETSPATYGGPASKTLGMGIGQWTGDPGRGGEFARFCQQNGFDVNSEAGNVAYMDYELSQNSREMNVNGPALVKQLQQPGITATQAQDFWLAGFEKATQPHADSRNANAVIALKFLKTGNSDELKNRITYFFAG